ncbi:hypothetical protein BV25DRAFT_1814497, partial [Artomyces pyxidatus]
MTGKTESPEPHRVFTVTFSRHKDKPQQNPERTKSNSGHLPDSNFVSWLDPGIEEVYCAAPSGDVLTAYKRVDQKVRPVAGTFPQDARVRRQIPEDPLTSLPLLTKHPPEFTPTTRISTEGINKLEINKEGFLWPEEEKLFKHIMVLNEQALAFEDDQRGTIKESYMSPYIIPTVPHEPWVHKNIPIPPGIKNKVIDLLREKMRAGVYEPSQSSYRSRWFCVVKKNGK